MIGDLRRWLAVDGATKFAVWYCILVTGVNLAWEVAHAPLYTLWREPWPAIVYGVLHCTGRDLLVAGASLALAILAFGRSWPSQGHLRVASAATAVEIVYTVSSEWVHTRFIHD